MLCAKVPSGRSVGLRPIEKNWLLFWQKVGGLRAIRIDTNLTFAKRLVFDAKNSFRLDRLA